MKFKYLLNLILAFIATFNINETALATNGTESGGGGDPDAVDFLLKVKTIGEWSLRTHIGISDSNALTINSIAKKLIHLMDDPTVTPISMVEQDLFDTSGVSKVAIFDLNSFKIQVTRSKWKALSDEDKYVLAALELFGLSQLQDRYAIAGFVKQDFHRIKEMKDVVNQNWSYLSVIKIGDVVTYEAPGIYKSTEEIYPMATNLKDLDVDYEKKLTGLKMATEFCKAMGHTSGVSLSFKNDFTLPPTVVGAFFNTSQGYIGLRKMNFKGIQPDIAVQYLNCK